MSLDLKTCVVSIRHQENRKKIVGTGFVVDARHVFTCAHVVAKAGAEPGDTVRLKFEATGSFSRAEILADCYRDRFHQDLAVLHLVKPIPDGVLAAPLAPHAPTRSFLAYGYHALDIAADLPSSYAHGDILNDIPHNAGFSLLQLNAPQKIAGMSGGPILDTVVNRVVGMVLSQSRADDTKVALPVTEIERIWPDLPVLVRPDEPEFTVPFEENDDFVGREEDLEKLHKALQGSTGVAPRGVGIRPAGLTGMGGIGKTQLAVEYCYRRRADYPGGIFWINAAEPLRAGFAALGRRLHPDLIDRPLDVQIDAAAHYLRRRDDALLVLDNVADPKTLQQQITPNLIPARLPRLLFTTRERRLDGFAPVELTVLPEEPALKLLLNADSRQPILDPIHPEHATARDICAMLGYLPLALEVAAAHLGDYAGVGLAEYVAELKRGGALAVMEQGDVETRHELGLRAVLHSQYERLPYDEAKLLLQIAGQLPEAAVIPRARLGLFTNLPEKAERFFTITLDKALQPLIDASLVEALRGEQLRLHPLVRDFAEKLLDEDERAGYRHEWANNMANALGNLDTLTDQFMRRGIDALQEDLLAALSLKARVLSTNIRKIGVPPWRAVRVSKFSIADPVAQQTVGSRLTNLLRVLQQEAHVLRMQQNSRTSDYFRQQLTYRIKKNRLWSYYHLVDQTKDQAKSFFGLSWQKTRESIAIERSLSGHLSYVNAVAVTPDGARAVSASEDSTLKVWNLATGEAERTLSGHEDSVRAVAITPDGERAVSASEDSTLKVWNLATGEAERTLSGHEDSVRAVAITPDGERIVSTSEDSTLKVWNLATGKAERTLSGHSFWVLAVAVTPDGARAISASSDRTLKVWNLATWEEERTLHGHSAPVNAVAVTPDGARVISASNDKTLKVWTLATWEEERTLHGHSAPVNAVAVTPDGARVVSASDDRTLKVWNLVTGEAERTLCGHSYDVYAVAVTPDGARAISASDDRTLKVWNLATGEEERTLSGHSASVRAVAVTPDGARAISASDDRTLKVWNLATGEEERTLHGHSAPVNAVAVTLDGARVVSASDDRMLKIWNLATWEEERTLRGHSTPVNAVAVMGTPGVLDRQRAISASDNGTLKVWNLVTGEEEQTLHGYSTRVNAVAVTPDGARAISASADRMLKVWNLVSWEEERPLRGHSYYVTAVAVTPDGARVIAAFANGTLEVWNLTAGEEERTLHSHSSWASAVAVTGTTEVLDKARVISASHDRTLKVWNLATGEELASITVEAALLCVAVSPVADAETGGITIVTGDAAGTVYCFTYYEAEDNEA